MIDTIGETILVLADVQVIYWKQFQYSFSLEFQLTKIQSILLNIDKFVQIIRFLGKEKGILNEDISVSKMLFITN